MSTKRLQVLIPEALDRRIRKAATRRQLPAGAWVREAIEHHLRHDQPVSDPLERLKTLGAPTGDVDQVLAEIEAGRG